jgi:hypothetical protein
MPRPVSRALFGAATLLCLAPNASAGPVRWNYSGVVEATNGGPFAHFGVEEQHWFDPTTGAEGATPYQILGHVDATFSGSGVGRGDIHAGAYGVTCLEAFPIDDPWALNRPNRFLVRVTIFDVESGESAEVAFEGTGMSNGYFQSGTGVVNLWVEPHVEVFELGGHRYAVGARVRESESAAHIELAIDATHHNPEPATLALAGIGLCGLGVVRRLRKK